MIKSKGSGLSEKSTGAVVEFQEDSYFELLEQYLKGPGLSFRIDQDDGGEIAGRDLAYLRSRLTVAYSNFESKPSVWENSIETFTLDPRTGERKPYQIRRRVVNLVLMEIIKSLLALAEEAERNGERLIFIGD